MSIQKEIENWDSSSLNAENPNAITIASFFRKLRESRSQYHPSEQTDQSRDSEQHHKTCTSI